MTEEDKKLLVEAFNRLDTASVRDRSDSSYTDFFPGSEVMDKRIIAITCQSMRQKYTVGNLPIFFWMHTAKLVCPPSQGLGGSFLDIGAGAGHWVQDVAQIHTENEVIGIDLHYTNVPETPAKSSFEVDDCEMEFAARPDPVSLVNLRES